MPRAARERREREEEREERDFADEHEEERWWQALVALCAGAASGTGEPLDVHEIAKDVDDMLDELRTRQGVE